jgi:hypothetical protein
LLGYSWYPYYLAVLGVLVLGMAYLVHIHRDKDNLCSRTKARTREAILLYPIMDHLIFSTMAIIILWVLIAILFMLGLDQQTCEVIAAGSLLIYLIPSPAVKSQDNSYY